MLAWAEYSQQGIGGIRGKSPGPLPPLLPSSKVRLKVQEADLGSSSLSGVTLPGETLKLNLGTSKGLYVQYTPVMAKYNSKEEDKSSWFVKDKRTYRIRTVESITTLRNTNLDKKESSFVLVAENLPVSTEEMYDKVQLITPVVDSIQSIDGILYSLELWEQEKMGGEAALKHSKADFIAAILAREGKRGKGVALNQPSVTVYFDPLHSNLYWAVWLPGGQSTTLPFKYQITSPEGRPLTHS